ncbi:MAG: hypothetical protein P8Z79_08770 [Sedimentisphaerales bacterium]
MADESIIARKGHKAFARTKVLLVFIGLGVVVATTCFIVLSYLPPTEGPSFKAPLRSFLMGLGLLGVAAPPYVVGLLLKKRAAASPYFELSFIRTGFNIVALMCFSVGLTCIGLSVYALILRELGPH